MKKRVRLKISGRVQGICYRAETQTVGTGLGLSGYAQNNRDGTVTVVAVGEEKNLEKLVEWCRKGPAGARVDSIETVYGEPAPDEEFNGFEIL